MSPKELIKLAAACRRAGIRHYKSADMEFTLTDEAPVSAYKAKKQVVTSAPDANFESDDLDGDAMLYWSSAIESKDKE